MTKYEIARKELEMFFAAIGDDLAQCVVGMTTEHAAGKHASQLVERSKAGWNALSRADQALQFVTNKRRTREHYEKLTAVMLDIAESLDS